MLRRWVFLAGQVVLCCFSRWFIEGVCVLKCSKGVISTHHAHHGSKVIHQKKKKEKCEHHVSSALVAQELQWLGRRIGLSSYLSSLVENLHSTPGGESVWLDGRDRACLLAKPQGDEGFEMVFKQRAISNPSSLGLHLSSSGLVSVQHLGPFRMPQGLDSQQ